MSAVVFDDHFINWSVYRTTQMNVFVLKIIVFYKL